MEAALHAQRKKEKKIINQWLRLFSLFSFFLFFKINSILVFILVFTFSFVISFEKCVFSGISRRHELYVFA